ncbi:MAG: hypothetical protein Q4G52_04635 [Clostridia bacterium]|nr:hypothetical protein [Clostridia bacterium]
MRKVLALLLVLLMGASCAAADSEGSVTQYSCSIVQSGEYYLVYCFAQIHNDSNSVICLERGSFDLHSGEQLLATEEVSQLWPYFLAPGEDGYVFDIVSFEPGENGAVVPQVTAISYTIEYMTVGEQTVSRDLSCVSRVEEDVYGGTVVICELTNNTDDVAYDPTVAFGLYTDEGAMIYADGVTLKDVGIPAGGTTLVRFRIDEVFVKQWEGYGVKPAEARVNASFGTDDD